jgi:hypothetical protein
LSKGWILLGAITALIVICVSVVSYYYKHKIMVWKQKNDMIHLLDDIEPMDFHELSQRHESENGFMDLIELNE